MVNIDSTIELHHHHGYDDYDDDGDEILEALTNIKFFLFLYNSFQENNNDNHTSKMVDTQHFCLRWNNYQSSITSAFENLRDDEDFVDVTLACDGRSLKAHRVVLSACSPYFRELLKVSLMKKENTVSIK
jgi:BTB/POZ domain